MYPRAAKAQPHTHSADPPTPEPGPSTGPASSRSYKLPHPVPPQRRPWLCWGTSLQSAREQFKVGFLLTTAQSLDADPAWRGSLLVMPGRGCRGGELGSRGTGVGARVAWILLCVLLGKAHWACSLRCWLVDIPALPRGSRRTLGQPTSVFRASVLSLA